MAIVPAVLALLGDKAWWQPKWLDRILPRIDVEGEALNHHRAEEPGEDHCGVLGEPDKVRA